MVYGSRANRYRTPTSRTGLILALGAKTVFGALEGAWDTLAGESRARLQRAQESDAMFLDTLRLDEAIKQQAAANKKSAAADFLLAFAPVEGGIGGDTIAARAEAQGLCYPATPQEVEALLDESELARLPEAEAYLISQNGGMQ